MMQLPYAGLRVLDRSQGIAGPYCAPLLARQGAAATKLQPQEDDWSPAIGQRLGGHTATALTYNHSERSLAIKMKRPGAAVIQRVAERCAIVIENFRPGLDGDVPLDAGWLAISEHGVQVLREAGLDDQALDDVRVTGVLVAGIFDMVLRSGS